ALLITAALGECWSILRASRVPGPAVRCCLLLGAISAVVTAALGWLHARSGYGAGMPQNLFLHRWLGTAAAFWAVVTAVLSERDVRLGKRGRPTRVLLIAGALLVALAGHTGGLLTHGEDFFDG